MKKGIKTMIASAVLAGAFAFAGLSSSVTEAATVDSETESTVKVYAVTNPNMGETLYTADEHEKDLLLSLGYTNGDIAFITSAKSSVPVYRVYNPNSGSHLFTVNEKEKDYLLTLGYQSEGIAFYSQGHVTIYRCYDNTTGLHRYTLDEKDKQVEGFAFRVVEADKDVINAYFKKAANTSVKVTETGCSLYRTEEGYVFSWGAKAVNAGVVSEKDVVLKAVIYDYNGNVVDTREALLGNLAPGAFAYAGSTLPIDVKGKLITKAVISVASEKPSTMKGVTATDIAFSDIAIKRAYSSENSFASSESLSFAIKNESKEAATGFVNLVYRDGEGSLLGVAKTDAQFSSLKYNSKVSKSLDMDYPGPDDQMKSELCFIDTTGTKVIVRESEKMADLM